MWVYLQQAFISVVEHREDPDQLLVRARVNGDLERIFGDDIDPEYTPDADYAFRVSLPRERVARAVAKQVFLVDYPNFKAGVTEHDRHDAYLCAWGGMVGLQRRRLFIRQSRDEYAPEEAGAVWDAEHGDDCCAEEPNDLPDEWPADDFDGTEPELVED